MTLSFPFTELNPLPVMEASSLRRRIDSTVRTTDLVFNLSAAKFHDKQFAHPCWLTMIENGSYFVFKLYAAKINRSRSTPGITTPYTET